jgi:hypothetical protein
MTESLANILAAVTLAVVVVLRAVWANGYEEHE